jgi:hypothetical protein
MKLTELILVRFLPLLDCILYSVYEKRFSRTKAGRTLDRCKTLNQTLRVFASVKIGRRKSIITTSIASEIAKQID